MRSLYLRIYLTVLAALALFALLSGWLVQRHFDSEREALRSTLNERVVAWAELLQRSLPPADAPEAEQAAALIDWSGRLRLPLALDDAGGHRIAASPSFERRDSEPPPRRAQAIALVDGRTLWLMRGQPRQPRAAPAPGVGMAGMSDEGLSAPRAPRPPHAAPWWSLPMLPILPGAAGLALLLLVIFAAIAAGAWPVVRRLTRRLEDLKRGVEAFGAGALDRRVAEDGRDEVSALAVSFNRAAARIEALLGSHRSLLANASHELRSPLARLKMAVSLLDDAAPAQRERLKREIHTDIGELDALVEEVLMASRLDAQSSGNAAPMPPVELLALAAEEACGLAHDPPVRVDGEPVQVLGDERLLRRALRNLLENARRYGGGAVEVRVGRGADGRAEVSVCDRGPGVPEPYRERIFEAFFRLPGHAEQAGGVGLGLALVRQIARHHGGEVRCQPRDGGGSCFRLQLPAA